MIDADSEDISFGPFRLSLRQRMLLGADGAVPLSSRAFDMLAALVVSRHSVLSKDQLMRAVWPNVVVEENNLHVQMAAIRRALGPHHRYIVTIPGRGYRFVGDPSQIEPPAPPRRPEANATNLPAPVTALIGREAELAATIALLRQARLVTLVGPGGVGKTKLALVAAHALQSHFPAGCWLIELGPIADADLVAGAIAASTQIEELPDRPLIESLITALRAHPMLLLIDGCEHMAAKTAELVDLLLRRCPDLRVLCTSQTPLGAGGEHVRRIAPFELPETSSAITAEFALRHDAVRLFVERVTAGDERFELTDAMAPSVVDICRSLDGIPLAIELAAARVPLLGLGPVRVRIANRLALLGEDRAGVADRHRTLRAAIEWSCSLLPEIDRRMLRRLSVFPGGFTLAAAQRIAAGIGFAEWDVVRSVGNLVRRSLLVTGSDLMQPRHRMLAATREFAVEALLAAEEHTEVAAQHAAYYWDMVETTLGDEGPGGTGGDTELIVPELENLRTALGWALAANGDPALGARLAAATVRFWFETGHLNEGRGWIARALAHAPADLEPDTLIRLYRGLAELSMEPAAAVAAAQQALHLAAERPQTEGLCLRTLAAAQYRMGRYSEAEQSALRAFSLLRGTPHLRALARCLGDLCILRGVAGDYAEARHYNSEAQALLKALGDSRGAAICLQYAAEFEFAAGETSVAVELAEESVALFRDLHSRYYLEVGLANLAAYRLAADDPEGARIIAREALAIADEIEDQTGVVVALEHVALSSALLGVAEIAARLHGYVEESYRKQGLERQETELNIHKRLIATLTTLLPEDRRTRLQSQGAMLPPPAAVALALG